MSFCLYIAAQGNEHCVDSFSAMQCASRRGELLTWVLKWNIMTVIILVWPFLWFQVTFWRVLSEVYLAPWIAWTYHSWLKYHSFLILMINCQLKTKLWYKWLSLQACLSTFDFLSSLERRQSEIFIHLTFFNCKKQNFQL